VVFTNGCFDILHVGHVRYLEEARASGDVLVVGLNRDSSVRKIKGPKRPVNDEMSRAQVMAALSSVNYVSLFEEDTAQAIVTALRPDIYVKGGDWKVEETPEGRTVLAYGGQVKAMNFVDGFSTTAIIERAKT
jgi:glycerol-3-phosphate cytidylyltransferase